MNSTQSIKAGGAVATLVATVLSGMLSISPSAQAQETEATLSQIGLAITPVPLNMVGKDPVMVGLGSYLVNAVGDCNGCHTGGGPPNFNYAAGGNPYFGQNKKVDPTVYLSGGSDFGPVGTPTGPNMYAGPDIIARNLTPDKTGLPEGGHTLAEFLQIMTIGTDYDNLHPTCTPAQLAQIEAGTTPPPVCIPTSPGNTAEGNLLQVMPWPTFANMSQYDLTAIYAYLSAIPCLAGTTDTTSPLYNDCGSGGGTTPPPPAGITIVITGPGGATSATNTFQTNGSQVSLNASQSTSTNSGPLSYSWQPAPGSAISIPQGNTATPFIQILGKLGTYSVILTVTDSTGATATATVILQYT
jgi:hypothetical protein